MSKMSFIFIAFVMTVFTGLSYGAQSRHATVHIQHTIEKWRKEFNSPGIALSIGSLNDNKITDYYQGTMSVEHKQLLSGKTKFRASSITKTLISVMVLQLEDEGKLTLEDTVEDVSKQYGIFLPTEVYGAWKHINIKQLLTMTSGIDSLNQKPLFSPGDGWHYSDANYTILVKLIEAISKQNLYEEFNQRFVISEKNRHKHALQILDMKTKNVIPQLAKGYDLLNHPVSSDSLMSGGEASALVSSPHELVWWQKHLYTEKFINKAQMKKFMTIVSKSTGKVISNATSAGYGLGIDRYFSEDLGTLWYYPGNSPGYTALIVYIPSKKLIFAVMMNKESDRKHFFSTVVHDLPEICKYL